MKSAKVQLRRERGGTWTVLSSFPDNLPAGIAPVHKHGECPFTGDVKNASETGTIPAPNWPSPKKGEE